MASIQHKRGTRAQLNSAASSNQLKVGELYLITDEDRLAVGTAVNTYQEVAKDSELFSGNYNDLTNKPTIPSALSQLAEDANHRVVTDSEKSTWNSKADGSHGHNLSALTEDANHRLVTDTEKSTWNSKLDSVPSNTDATKIANGTVNNTEFQYLNGVTSAIQTQLNNKASTSHNHNLADLSEKSYNSLTNKPSIPTIPATVTQAEAEAGTSTATRLWTPQRVKQAIDALAGGGGLWNNEIITTVDYSTTGTLVFHTVDITGGQSIDIELYLLISVSGTVSPRINFYSTNSAVRTESMMTLVHYTEDNNIKSDGVGAGMNNYDLHCDGSTSYSSSLAIVKGAIYQSFGNLSTMDIRLKGDPSATAYIKKGSIIRTRVRT